MTGAEAANALFVATILVYAAAMFAYALEYAFDRREGKRVGEKALVAAGAAADRPAEPAAAAPLTPRAARGVRGEAAAGSAGRSAAAPAAPSAFSPTRFPSRRSKADSSA